MTVTRMKLCRHSQAEARALGAEDLHRLTTALPCWLAALLLRCSVAMQHRLSDTAAAPAPSGTLIDPARIIAPLSASPRHAGVAKGASWLGLGAARSTTLGSRWHGHAPSRPAWRRRPLSPRPRGTIPHAGKHTGAPDLARIMAGHAAKVRHKGTRGLSLEQAKLPPFDQGVSRGAYCMQPGRLEV